MDLYEIRQLLKTGQQIYTMPLRVTFYARVSSSTDEQLNSIDNQVKHFTDFIGKNAHWTLIDPYVDVVRAESVKNRKAFLQMIEDAKAKKFDLILTKEISRFARDTVDSLSYTKLLLSHNVGVLFQEDNINTLHDDSELRLAIMASIAQDEVRKLSNRVKFGHSKAIENKHVLGNDRIYGYNYDNCRLTIHDREAELVRLIFELYAGGMGGNPICRKLLELGYLNRNGKPFSHNTIYGIIQNPKYKGYYCGGKVKIVDYKTKKQHFVREEDWVMEKDETGELVPALVSEELWDVANRLYKERSALKKIGKSTWAKTPYSGKIYCAEHAEPFHRNSYDSPTKGRMMLWQCKTKRSAIKANCQSPNLYETELDSIIRLALTPVIKNLDSLISDYRSFYQQSIKTSEYQKDIQRIKASIAKVNDRKERLLDFSIDGSIPKAEFLRRNTAYNADLDNLNTELKKLEDLDDRVDLEKGVKAIQAIVESIIEETEPKIEYLLALVDQIIVGPVETDDDGTNSFALTLLLTTGFRQDYWYYKDREKNICLQLGGMVKKMIESYEQGMK